VAIVAVLAAVASSAQARSVAKVVRATHNIYCQQYQMGLFVRRAYAGMPIVLHDIGAVDYLADVKLLDLAGLGSIEMARLIRAGGLDKRRLAERARDAGARIAIVYDARINRLGVGTAAPPGWVKVGEWITHDNVIMVSDTVSFYALQPPERARLAANLKRFSTDLPKDVRSLILGPVEAHGTVKQ
jgi:hypothetical protein